MRIGINASFLAKPMTGIGQVTREFLERVVNDPQFHTEEWFLYTDGELTEEQKRSIPKANWQWRPITTWWKRQDIPHQYLFESQALPCVVDGDNIDVFLSLYQSATVLPEGIRHVMLVHDVIPKLFPEYLNKWTSRFHYERVCRAITKATLLLTPSQTTKNDLVALFGIDKDRIAHIPLGVDERFAEHLDPAILRENLKRYELAPGYLYHGGGLEIRKNTEAVLRAYAALVQENFSMLPPLVISGKIHAETNPLATPVKRLIQELQLEDKVKLLGLVPEADLPVLYQGASMFLFPSRYEGFGLPVLEAFASGTPVITTTAGSLKELTDQGEAFLIQNAAQSDQEIKEAVKQLLTQPSLALGFRTKGLERAKQYTWEHFTETTMKTLLQ